MLILTENSLTYVKKSADIFMGLIKKHRSNVFQN